MGAPDPENPLFLGFSVLRGGLRRRKGPDHGVGVDPETVSLRSPIEAGCGAGLAYSHSPQSDIVARGGLRIAKCLSGPSMGSSRTAAEESALQGFLDECNYLAGRGAEGLNRLKTCIASAPSRDWGKSVPLVACVMNLVA